MSSNVNEIIRAVLNSLIIYLFFTKRSCTQQKHQKHQKHQKNKKRKNTTKQKHNKLINDFFP